MTAHAAFTQRLGIRYPIIQAPMAGVSTPALAAAVSNAGGLGSLGLGASSVAQAEQMLRDTRALTSAPVNINVFCHAPAERDVGVERDWIAHFAQHFAAFGCPPPDQLQEIYPSFVHDSAMQELLLDVRPAVVSFHFGLPPQALIRRLQQAGIITLASATSPAEAQQIVAADVDGIVAQGIEAGGHRGVFDTTAADAGSNTLTLVQQIARQHACPVIAAGGLMQGRDIRNALAAGAAAVQLGTAFVLCPESAAAAPYRAALAQASTTVLTRAISGRPARGLANTLTRHGEQPGAPAIPAYPVAYDLAKQLHAAASAAGDQGYAAWWAGTGVAAARSLPAATLLQTLVTEWQHSG